VIPLSARREDQLHGIASQLLAWSRARRLTPAELADVAHTLQVGRDAYEERLGLLVRSQDELEAALGDFLAGRPVGHLGRGVTPTPAAHADALYEQYRAGRFDEVLDAWAGGQDLDWDRLAASGVRSRVPLPVYPFARLRHWHPPHGTATPLAPAPRAVTAQRLHPLLHQNRSSLFEQRFTAAFTGEEAFLDGHRVEGHRVLPGSVSLEMARLAGALSLEQEVRSIRNVLWRHPVVVADEPVETTVRLHPEEDSVLVRIGMDQGPPEARICMEARVSPDPASSGPAGGMLDLAEVAAGCEGKLPGSAVYAAMAEAGLDNGPAFQVIEEVLFRDGEAVVQLALPSAADRHEADVLPPALVNGAFQAVSVLMAGRGGGLLLPFSIASVDIHGPLPDECVAHLRHRGADGGGTVDRFDITLTDLAGTALVVVRDYALKSLPNAAQDR
jgi:polyketide synthase PksN